SMDLLASQADNSRAKDLEDRALDLALFDCYACHHDLKIKSWRQERGYTGKPGRPQFRPWLTALPQLGVLLVKQDDSTEQFQSACAELRKAFDAQPFGKPDEVASTAPALQKTLQAFEPNLVSAAASLNETNLSSLLQQVCERGASETSDYDSARQLAWALRVIHEELKPKLTNEAAIANELKALNQL